MSKSFCVCLANTKKSMTMEVKISWFQTLTNYTSTSDHIKELAPSVWQINETVLCKWFVWCGSSVDDLRDVWSCCCVVSHTEFTLLVKSCVWTQSRYEHIWEIFDRIRRARMHTARLYNDFFVLYSEEYSHFCILWLGKWCFTLHKRIVTPQGISSIA